MPAPKGHPPYPGCEKGGRPKKYTTEFIENEADEFEKWMKRENSLWYQDFCLERGFLPDEIANFAKVNEKFSRVYDKAKVWQQSLLVRGGLLSKFNSSITKLVLANTCGWTDKQQVAGEEGNPLVFLLYQADGSSKDLVNEED